MNIVNAATIDNTVVTNIILIDASEIDDINTVLIPDNNAFPIQAGDLYQNGVWISSATVIPTQDSSVAAIDSILNSL